MIKVEGLSKSYKVQGKRKVIFDNLSFELPPSGRLALIGPNGAGKSTLLRLLSGAERPNKGKITRQGTLSWPVGIASGFIGNLTAEENIKFICQLFDSSKTETRQKINFVRDFAEIGDYFKMPFSTYSSGMRSRVTFGLSMAFEFDYYILDETMAVGDATFKQKCKEVLAQRVKDKGMILVSHSMNDIKRFCNEGFFLEPGKITYEKNIKTLVKKYNNYCANNRNDLHPT